MMRNTPGQLDRQIGRQDRGGYGGGRLLCPIFDTTTSCRNFGFRQEDATPDLIRQVFHSREGNTFQFADIIPPPEVDALDANEIAVLNIPVLFYYSIETHYGIDHTTAPTGETPQAARQRLLNFQVRNWVTLITRAVADPTNRKLVEDFLRVAIVRVRLASSRPTIDPRKHLIDVQTTMDAQIVPGQSYGVPVPNAGRVNSKSRVRQSVDALRSRTQRLLNERLPGGG